MDNVFFSLCDVMPICNQWNVEKHASVKDKIAWAAAQGGVYSYLHGMCWNSPQGVHT
jgi:hypothetical protein